MRRNRIFQCEVPCPEYEDETIEVIFQVGYDLDDNSADKVEILDHDGGEHLNKWLLSNLHLLKYERL